MTSDECCAAFAERAAANYSKRGGRGAIPWEQIIAIVMELITSCFLSKPEGSAMRAPGFFQRVRLSFALRRYPREVFDAVLETAKESTDEETAAFYDTARECCA